MKIATTRLDRGNKKALVFFLIPLVLVGPLSMDMYLPALAVLQNHFSASEYLVQWTLSIFVLGFGLSQLIIGELAVRYGRHNILTGGCLLYFFSSIGCAWSINIYFLICFRFLQALGSCCCMVLSMAAVRGLVSDINENTRSYSLLSGCTAIAPIIAPIVGAFCINFFGSWTSIFYCLAFFMIVGTCIYFVKLRPVLYEESVSGSRVSSSFLTIIKDKQFWSYAIFTAGGMTIIFTFFSISPLIFIQQYNLSSIEYAFVFGCCASSFLIGNLIGPKQSKKFGINTVLSASYVGLFFLGTFLAIASTIQPSLWTFILSMVGIEFCIGLTFGPAMSGAMMNYDVSSDRASAILGFQQFIISFLVGTSIVLLGLTSQAYMGLVAAVLSLGILVINSVLTRLSHQPLGKLGTSVFPDIPSDSLGNVYEHSLRESLEISKKQTVQPSSRAGEKDGLRDKRITKKIKT